tara:strand:+ start:1086 stop:1658 length:573 start_codon:yes stop_codon:yes gene_type:complete
MASITSLPSGVSGSSLVLISEQTASSSANITFDSDIDSTYKEYVFKFINCHPATNNVNFQVNFRDGGSSYDATKTTTFFSAYHNEADGTTNLGYVGSSDLAQATGVQPLSTGVGNDNDQCIAGTLHLFNPSSTTFVKHFIATTNISEQSDFTENSYIAGYCNVTAAINGVQFSFSSGNIDSGTIKMYGVV